MHQGGGEVAGMVGRYQVRSGGADLGDDLHFCSRRSVLLNVLRDERDDMLRLLIRNEPAGDLRMGLAGQHGLHSIALETAPDAVHFECRPGPGTFVGREAGLPENFIYAKAFLGINLSCVSCHDGQGHLEKVNVYLSGKTREQFFQNAAFLAQTRYLMYWENGKPQSGEFLIDDGNPGYDTVGASMIRVPRLGGSSHPAFLLTGEGCKLEENPRNSFAAILTSHPQFARATVNLFWAQLMELGIVEPYNEFDLARQDPENLPEGWPL